MKVFVYGILMRDATEAAALHGYRLAFSRFATVRRCEGSVVLGGLVDANDAKLRTYDSIEGVRPDGLGYYRREEVEVDDADGNPVVAWVYMQNEHYFDEEPGSPALRAQMNEQYERLGHTVRAGRGD